MRSTIVLTLILLVAAFAVAQQDPAAPGAPGQSPSQAQSPSQQQRPNLPQSDAPAPPAAAGNIIEGCLGGSNPNFNITDKGGTKYELLIPQGADASVLTKHVGESVQVQGAVDAADSSNSAAAAPVGGHSIRVAKIGKGTGTCSAKK